MPATTAPSPNGSPRKSLAGQLDRLDSMLDGLDQALLGAVTDAVREAVSAAVAEGVRAALVELASNPQLLAAARGVAAPPAPPPAPQPSPTPSQAIRSRLSRAWDWSLAKVRSTGDFASAKLGGTGRFVKLHAHAAWALRRPLGVALTVGVAAGVVGYASSPWLAGVVSGLSATGAALAMQLALFARRLFVPAPAR